MQDEKTSKQYLTSDRSSRTEYIWLLYLAYTWVLDIFISEVIGSIYTRVYMVTFAKVKSKYPLRYKIRLRDNRKNGYFSKM